MLELESEFILYTDIYRFIYTMYITGIIYKYVTGIIQVIYIYIQGHQLFQTLIPIFNDDIIFNIEKLKFFLTKIDIQ